MEAVALSNVGFGAFLRRPIEKFVLDLSNASTLDVVDEYVHFKQKINPNYNMGGLIHSIRNIEQSFGIVLMPLQITDDFYSNYVPFMVNLGLKPSTIESYCGQLRTALQWGTRHNLRVSATFDQFSVPKYSPMRIALTPDEVSLIYHFDIDKNFIRHENGRKIPTHHIATLKRVKDMFVLSCNLGQRYSDMKRINPDNFNIDKTVFSITQMKTGNKAVVDLKEYTIDKRVTREILERYNYHAPYTADIANYNKLLHELLSKIGGNFNDTVASENKVDGEMVKTVKKKYEMIASHTGRRTFVTFNIKRDISEAKVRRCSGHSDSRSFVKYVVWGGED